LRAPVLLNNAPTEPAQLAHTGKDIDSSDLVRAECDDVLGHSREAGMHDLDLNRVIA
jgi:hypothetical protein